MAIVLELQLISPSNAHSGLDSQESSPTSQFKSFNSLVFSFLYSPTLHPYMTTGKTLALTRRNFVGKVMSLLFNMLSRLVITFLPRSKRLLINYAAKSLQLCPTLCDPVNRSTPGLPVHDHLPEFTQTHVHRVNDAIQPSHPLSSPFPPAPNSSQHQSLFQ